MYFCICVCSSCCQHIWRTLVALLSHHFRHGVFTVLQHPYYMQTHENDCVWCCWGLTHLHVYLFLGCVRSDSLSGEFPWLYWEGCCHILALSSVPLSEIEEVPYRTDSKIRNQKHDSYLSQVYFCFAFGIWRCLYTFATDDEVWSPRNNCLLWHHYYLYYYLHYSLYFNTILCSRTMPYQEKYR